MAETKPASELIVADNIRPACKSYISVAACLWGAGRWAGKLSYYKIMTKARVAEFVLGNTDPTEKETDALAWHVKVLTATLDSGIKHIRQVIGGPIKDSK